MIGVKWRLAGYRRLFIRGMWRIKSERGAVIDIKKEL
jgi:hypothetical protein